MTGLAIAAPPAGNIGVLLGTPEISGTAPAVPTGAVAFLDLLGFLGEGLPSEEPVEEAPLELEARAVIAPQASPKQIAEAVMRSMFQAPPTQTQMIPAQVLPKPMVQTRQLQSVVPEAFVAETPELLLEKAAAPVVVEDWDVPLDWVAPEEMVQEEENAERFEAVVEEVVSGPVPLWNSVVVEPVRADVCTAACEAGLTIGSATGAGRSVTAPAASHSVVPRSADPVVSGRLAQVVASRAKVAPAPLAFAMDLKAAMASPPVAPARPTSETSAVMVAGLVPQTPVEVEETVPVQETPRANSAANPVPTKLVVETAPSAPKQDSDPEQHEPQREETKLAGPVVTARVRGAKVEPRAEVPVPPPAQIPQNTLHIATASPAEAFPRPSAGASLPPITNAGPVEPASVPIKTHAAHQIEVRISAPDAAPVDLQVKERGGAVHVAVRTPDGSLQTSLRQDLGTLVDRLEQSGLHTEAVITRESGPRVENGASFDLGHSFRTHTLEASSANGDPPPERDGTGARDSGSGARQQNPQRRHQPHGQQQRWRNKHDDQQHQ